MSKETNEPAPNWEVMCQLVASKHASEIVRQAWSSVRIAAEALTACPVGSDHVVELATIAVRLSTIQRTLSDVATMHQAHLRAEGVGS